DLVIDAHAVRPSPVLPRNGFRDRFRRSRNLLGCPRALPVHPADAGHRLPVAFGSGLPVPLARLDVVLRTTPAVLVEPAEVQHAGAVARGSRLVEQLARFRVVALDAPSVTIEAAQVVRAE